MEMEEDSVIPSNWEEVTDSLIKVIGVGGGGSNAVNYMYATGIRNVDFAVCNTDAQALAMSPVPYKIQLGSTGLGAGCNPEQGRRAAEESEDKVRKLLSGNTRMVFITAGMGGGTGTGAAPVIARISRDMGKLTVGVVTIPFRHEGIKFIERAFAGIRDIKQYVDSLLVIDNQRLYDLYGDLTIFDAFPKADEVLTIAVKGIAEIITRPGFINIDYADVEMAMKDSGVAIMGTGKANGEQRALEAVEKALSSPLLNDSDVSGAKNVLVNITSSGGEKALTMSELEKIMKSVQGKTGAIENCKRGVVRDDSFDDHISVTIVATGFRIKDLDFVIPPAGGSSSNNGTEENEVVVVFRPLGDDDDDDRFDYSSKMPGSHIDEDNDNDNRDEEDDEPLSPTLPFNTEGITLAPNQRIYKVDSDGSGQSAPVPVPVPQPPPPASKPVLIVDRGDDISRLETESAFRRRNASVSPPPSTTASGAVADNTAQIVNINGSYKLGTNNTFLYQSED
ncbi:MAG: cell division protein FtsZ [Prevotellaceae bacterium]|jgi:cell division protein FtsZ|nr:cell division protein FtsZ [Prevotellaceae bacterium]